MVESTRALSVIVTGGASGIGAAVAQRVVAAGGSVGIIDLDGERAEAFARALGSSAIAYGCSVLDEDALEVGWRTLSGCLPPVNGLVNCAGVPPVPRAIEDYPVAEWNRIIESHLTGTYIPCRVIGSAIAAGGAGGAIVNLASVLSFRSGPVLAYGAAKCGVVNLTEALAVHWARHDVRVNAVAPGWTDTPFLRPKERRGERDLTPILNATPQRRIMRPEEIAEVIHFLLSPASSAITGATIPCDGGVIAGSGWAPYGGFGNGPTR
jgi:NAD(P)-dependent dehydrogenase (short-subunit alcohol dehydrogenase family)